LLAKAPYEDQQTIFRALPVDLAAKIVSQFPDYHEYVLLHSRPIKEMCTIVDSIDPAEKLRFLDELPDEAWQRLMSELAATTTETLCSPRSDHLKGQTISTIGLGATISHATDAGNFRLLLAATIVMAAVVVTVNRMLWRPMYRLAETRYRLEG
jgi:hypothetical protein